MEKTDAAIAKIIEAINAAAMQHGAAGVDIATGAIQAQAIFKLATAGFIVVAIIAFLLAAKRILAWAIPYGQQMDEELFTQYLPMISAVLFLFFGAVATVVGFIAVWSRLLDATLWASAIDGKLGLAMRILDKVL